ncbi:MAG: FHA domain-containing protein [Bacteroidales bacterium]|nr:FHA domain-containing protein [Bacteroidales bacterium]
MKTITIGRDATNNIVLNDNTVSRNHAHLFISGNGQVVIKDLGSSNGTFVNGNKISEQMLRAGDVVKCGSSFLNWSLAVNEIKVEKSILNPKPGISSQRPHSSFASGTIYIEDIRHEKEKTYFIVKLVFSILIWIFIAGLTILSSVFLAPFIIGIIFGIPFIILLVWLTSLSLKAVLYGNSVKVNVNQFPEIFNVSNEHASKLGLQRTPEIFICNSNGLINAFAIKAFSKRYVILMSSLVDLMLASKSNEALSMIIGHEIGHHAAGHTSFWKNLLLRPASIIPFLGAAYSRACELTADRIGFVLTNNLEESQNALFALALGSERLLQKSNITEFCDQENEIPDFIGFIRKIYSGHPRITKRVIEITSFAKRV